MKISVITVVYNGGDTVERTIRSVVNQKEVEIEYIVVDGGSTDNTLDVVEQFKNEISCILSEPDQGIYDAMNKGLRLANGDVVAFLNSDDWYESDTLKYIADVFRNKKLDVLCADARMVGKYGTWIRKADLDKKVIIRQLPTSHQAIFATREWFEKVGNFDTNYVVSADYDWVTRSIVGGCRIDVLPVIVVNFSLGGFSAKYEEISRKEIRDIALKYYTGTSLEGDTKRYWMYEDLLNKSREEGEFFWDKIKLEIPTDRDLYIFGVGKDGKKCYLVLNKLRYTVVGFIDNYLGEKQAKFADKMIRVPKTLKIDRDFIVIASVRYEDVMKKQLVEMGFKENVDFCSYVDIRNKILYE